MDDGGFNWGVAAVVFAASSTGYYFITPPESLQEAALRLDMNEDFDRDRILSTAAHSFLLAVCASRTVDQTLRYSSVGVPKKVDRVMSE